MFHPIQPGTLTTLLKVVVDVLEVVLKAFWDYCRGAVAILVDAPGPSGTSNALF